MKKAIIVAINALILAILISSCGSKSSEENATALDTAAIALGKELFNQNCTACHNFKRDGIGPHLGGLTAKVPIDWIKNFIRDPKAIIDSGDDRAQSLFAKYKAVMPSFGYYNDEQINGIVAYMQTQKSPSKRDIDDPASLKDPIPEKIAMSGLVADLELITQIPPSSEEEPITRIARLDFQPGTDKLFVLDLRGKLYYLKNNKPEVYMDMAQLRPAFINKPGLATGFGSFAFHPEFATNGLIYTTHTEPPATAKADFAYDDSIRVTLQWVLMEWKTKQPASMPFAGEGRELLRVNMVTGIHGTQELNFNPLAKKGDEDYGLLYLGVGDGGSVESGFPIAHSIERIWGTIIRIDPAGRNSTNGKYGIPANNPFVKEPKALKEIYAYGFRNPHRMSWSKAGQKLASNVGHHNIEGFNIILPGHDYGWPIREGTFVIRAEANMHNVFALPDDDAKYNVTYPVAQYDHDEGNAISGGFEYWGKDVPQLSGKYFFGDIVKGRLFYVEMKDLKLGSQAIIKEWLVSLNGKKMTMAELCGKERVNLRLGRDHRGELYVFTKADGKIYKIKGII